MRLALVALFLTAGLAGCTQDEVHRDGEHCVDGVCQQRSLDCMGDACEVCLDGSCVECERDECEACYEDGSCAGIATGGDGNVTFEDVRVKETYDLTRGLPAKSWVFDSAVGASGHAYIELHDLVTKEQVVMGGVCFTYLVETWTDTSHSRQSGSQGSCGGMPVSGTTTSQPIVLADWPIRGRGHYEFTVSAGDATQPNELVVDLLVDNP